MRSLIALGVLLAPALTQAAGLSHVRATSQLEAGADRGRYHPLNLLDDDPETIWCEGAAGLGEGDGVQITFKRPQRIDRVVINTTPKSGRVIQSVRVSDGTRGVSVTLGQAGAVEEFSRPLEGTTFEITIERVAEATETPGVGRDVACLADTLLYLRDNLFGGGAGKLRFDARLDRVVGAWHGGPLGAPEQSLRFSLDGSWEWTFKPLLGGRGKRLAGEFRFRGDRLLMRAGEVGRWTDMGFKFRRVRVESGDLGAPQGDYDVIVLGPGLGADVAGEYNNAQF